MLASVATNGATSDCRSAPPNSSDAVAAGSATASRLSAPARHDDGGERADQVHVGVRRAVAGMPRGDRPRQCRAEPDQRDRHEQQDRLLDQRVVGEPVETLLRRQLAVEDQTADGHDELRAAGDRHVAAEPASATGARSCVLAGSGRAMPAPYGGGGASPPAPGIPRSGVAVGRGARRRQRHVSPSPSSVAAMIALLAVGGLSYFSEVGNARLVPTPAVQLAAAGARYGPGRDWRGRRRGSTARSRSTPRAAVGTCG